MKNKNKVMKFNGSYSKGEAMVKTVSDVLSSNNPGKWVAAIALGTIVVGGMAIKTIDRMSRRD